MSSITSHNNKKEDVWRNIKEDKTLSNVHSQSANFTIVNKATEIKSPHNPWNVVHNQMLFKKYSCITKDKNSSENAVAHLVALPANQAPCTLCVCVCVWVREGGRERESSNVILGKTSKQIPWFIKSLLSSFWTKKHPKVPRGSFWRR